MVLVAGAATGGLGAKGLGAINEVAGAAAFDPKKLGTLGLPPAGADAEAAGLVVDGGPNEKDGTGAVGILEVVISVMLDVIVEGAGAAGAEGNEIEGALDGSGTEGGFAPNENG